MFHDAILLGQAVSDPVFGSAALDLSLKTRSSKYCDSTQDISNITENPSYSVNISDLGEDGHLVSNFIKYQADNPLLQSIDLTGHSMHLDENNRVSTVYISMYNISLTLI